jgi:hypothetical protein
MGFAEPEELDAFIGAGELQPFIAQLKADGVKTRKVNSARQILNVASSAWIDSRTRPRPEGKIDCSTSCHRNSRSGRSWMGTRPGGGLRCEVLAASSSAGTASRVSSVRLE